MWNTEGRALAHQRRGVQNFLDLVGADAIARRLDHLVAPTDEVQKPVFVLAYGVARENRDLRQHQAGLAAWQRPKSLGGLFGVVPVALRHQCAALNEFAWLMWIAGRAIGAQHQHFAVGDRLADRIGPTVDLFRGEIGRAERLGETVHQEWLGMRHDGAQRLQCFARHAATGVGEVAEMRADVGPLHLRQLDPQRWHRGQAGDPMRHDCLDHVLGQQVVQQHHAGAGMKRGGQLAEPCIERQGQRSQQHIAAVVVEVATQRSWLRRPCCDATARRLWACRCFPMCRGCRPCRVSITRCPRSVAHRAHRSRHAHAWRTAPADDSSPVTITCARSGHWPSTDASDARRSALVTRTRTQQSRRM